MNNKTNEFEETRYKSRKVVFSKETEIHYSIFSKSGFTKDLIDLKDRNCSLISFMEKGLLNTLTDKL